jgi:hypothetical protein
MNFRCRVEKILPRFPAAAGVDASCYESSFACADAVYLGWLPRAFWRCGIASIPCESGEIRFIQPLFQIHFLPPSQLPGSRACGRKLFFTSPQ